MARSSFRLADATSGQGSASGFRVLMPVAAVSRASKPNPSAEAKHRLALEWVLKVGGTLSVKVDGKSRKLDRSAGLPTGLFALERIDLWTGLGIKADELKQLADVTGEFFFDAPPEVVEIDSARVLAGISGIGTLSLGNVNPEFTAAIGNALGNCPVRYLILKRRNLAPGSIAALKRLPNLDSLLLLDCTVPEAVLQETAELPRLRHLNVQGSGTTDQNLAALSLPNLASLAIYATPVTAQGLAAFQRRHPDRTIAGHNAIAEEFRSILAAANTGFALEFDGVDDYVELPLFKFEHDKPLTIEAWFFAEPEDLAGKPELETVVESVLSAADGPGNRSFSLLLDRPNAAWWAGLSDPQRLHSIYYWFTRVDRRTDLYATRHHAAVVWDGSKLSMFVDGRRRESGRPVTENSALPTRTPSKLSKYHIGAVVRDDGETLSNFFHGRIDELRFSQAARYANDFSPPAQFESEGGTLALYHFDEGTGEVLKDSSGNNHHGKIVGAKWVQSAESLGGPLPAPGKFALDFAARVDTGAARVETPRLARPNEPCTVEVCVTPRSVARGNRVVWSLAGKLLLKQLQEHLIWEANKPKQVLANVVARGAAQPGRRVYVAAVSTGRELRLFLDGRLVGTSPIGEPLLELVLPGTLGGMTQVGDDWSPFDGTIDAVRISKTARYDKDYTPAARFETDADTLVLYRLDEETGDVLNDSSGNNHHGKIVGAKWIPLD